MRPKLVGIRDLPTSRQAYVTVYGKFYSQTFPLGTADSVLKEWRARKRAEVKYGTTPQGSTFAEDCDSYLALRQGMASYVDRAYHIEQWRLVFGNRERRRLTSAEIRRQLELWKQSGRYDGKPLSHGSLNLRRTALLSLFTVLDGKAHPNVVKDVPLYDERPSRQVRAVPLLTIAKLLRRLKPWSKARPRLRVLMWTGWPSKLLKQVRPEDVDWDAGLVHLAARDKGKGMPDAWIPVLPAGLRALRRLFALKLDGPFENSTLLKAMQRAAGDGLPRVNVYAIRHSFATWAARQVKDDRALKELLRTNSIARYTDGASAERMREALQVLQGATRIQKDSRGSTALTIRRRSTRKTATTHGKSSDST